MYGFGQVAAPVLEQVPTGVQLGKGAFITLPAQLVEQMRPGTFGVGVGSFFSAVPFSLAVWGALIWLVMSSGGGSPRRYAR